MNTVFICLLLDIFYKYLESQLASDTHTTHRLVHCHGHPIVSFWGEFGVNQYEEAYTTILQSASTGQGHHCLLLLTLQNNHRIVFHSSIYTI